MFNEHRTSKYTKYKRPSAYRVEKLASPTLLLYAFYTKQESIKAEYILYIQEQVRRCDQRSSDPIEASKVPPKHRVAKIVLN